MKDIRRSREMLLDSILSETTYVVFRFLNCNSINGRCRKHKSKKCIICEFFLNKKKGGVRKLVVNTTFS